MNAIILAAGLGTRLAELTWDTPKALVLVNGRTMLEHQILRLYRAGFVNIVVNTHHFSEKVKSFIDGFDLSRTPGLTIMVSDETGLLLDTGGGIRKALRMFRDHTPVLVHNVDIFSGADLEGLYSSHLNSNDQVTMLTAERTSSRQLWFSSEGCLMGWSNKTTGQVRSPIAGFKPGENCVPRAFQGIHILSAGMLSELEKVKADKFSITDFYVDNADRLRIVSQLMPTDTPWVDAGKPQALAMAREITTRLYPNI